jgi:hypothetical protein
MKMTVHEALCEIKTSDKRIDKAILECAFCAANKEVNPKIAGIPVKDYEDEIRSKYQAITDLIKRNDAIKKAMSLSNAATKINVAGIEMSVAEAIYMMQHGITHKQKLVLAMTRALKNARETIEFENGTRLEDRLDKFIQATYGSKEKVTAEELDKASKDFKARNEYKLVDPIGIVDKIATLTEEIDKFQAAVDSAIQISNATTYIEIPD